jgi:hypothetical protein
MRPGVHFLDLVVWSYGPSMPGCTSPGDTVPFLGFLGAVDLGVAGLGWPSSPSSPFPPVKWVQVKNRAEHACLRVATADRLLGEVLTMVDRDILHPIRVGLREKENLPEFIYLPPGSLMPPSFCFCSAWLRALLTCLGHRRM